MKALMMVSFTVCMLFRPLDIMFAQWTQTGGPPGGQTWCISTSDAGVVFAATDAGLYRSTDGGSNWVLTTLPIWWYWTVKANADAKVFAVGSKVFYQSTDDGVTWERVVPDRGDPWSIATDGHSHVYLSTSAGLFESVDNGNAWRLADSVSGTRGIFFLSMTRNGSLFGAGFDEGVYRSLDSGRTWKHVLSGPHLYSLHASSDSVIYVGSINGILRSTNKGIDWIQSDSVLQDAAVWSIHSTFDSLVFAATTAGLYFSTNRGEHWLRCTSGIPAAYFMSVHVDTTGKVFAGTYGRGIYQSSDNGATWSAASSGLATSAVRDLVCTSGGTLVCYDGYAVYRSTNRGTSWMPTLVMSSLSSMIVSPNDSVFIGSGNGMYLSADDGASWHDMGPAGIGISPLAVTRNGAILANTSTGLHRSTNSGTTWSPVDSASRLYFNALVASQQGTLWAATDSGVYRSDDDGNHWLAMNFIFYYPVFSIGITSDNSLLAGSSVDAPEEGYDATLYRSTDNGLTWTRILDGTVTRFIIAQNGWVLSNRFNVQCSTDNGATWHDYSIGLGSGVACLVSAPDGYVYVGTNGRGVYRTNSPLTSVPTAQKDYLPKYFLGQNYPNPFNPATNISFSLPSKSFVSLKVFDVMGREVSVVVSEEMLAGTYSRQWNAVALPTGVYFYRLQMGSFSETRKLLLLR